MTFSNYWKKLEEKKVRTNFKEFRRIKNKGPRIMRKLRKNYCELVKKTKKDDFKKEDIDIFHKLEEFQKQFDDYMNQYDKNSYYKYKC